MTIKITEKTTLDKIMQRPGAHQILAKFHVPCISCPMAAIELGALNIGDVATAYKVDLVGLLKELNKLSPEVKKTRIKLRKD